MNALTFVEMKQMAELFAKSGTFADAREMAVAFVKIQAGAELGFGPFASMQVFDIIKGKVVMNANGQAIKVRAGGRYDYQILELTDQRCEIEFFELTPRWRPGEVIHVANIKDPVPQNHLVRRSLGKSAFSIEDAKAARIASEMYQKYPRNMLFSRAMTNGVAWYCPDAIGMRVYSEGELQDAGPAPSLKSSVDTPSLAREVSPSLEPAPASLPAIPKTLSEAVAQRSKDLVTMGSGATERVVERAAYDAEVAGLKDAMKSAITHREGLPVHPEELLGEDVVDRILDEIRRVHPKNGNPVKRKAAVCDTLHECFGLNLMPNDLEQLRARLGELSESALEDGLTKLKEKMKP